MFNRRNHEAELELLRAEKGEALATLASREAEIDELSARLRETLHLLEESRDRYADLYEFAPVGYMTINHNGTIQECNATFAAMVAKDQNALISLPFTLFLASAADLKRFLAHLERCRKEGERVVTEVQLKGPGDTPFDVELSSVPRADYSSRTIVYRTAVTDVSERRRAQQARDETMRQLRIIMDAAPIPIGYLDRDQRFVFVNNEYLAKFRLDQRNVLGHTFREVHGSDTDDLIADRLTRGVAGEFSVVESAVTCQRSGKEFFLRVNIAPDCSPGSVPCGIVIVVTDLTEQKMMLEDLRQAKDAADVASRTKSQFLANMSHELRTPLNGLLGMIQLVLQSDARVAPKQSEQLAKAYHAGKSLLRILNDLLDLSKIEAGTLSLEHEPFSLHKCVKEAVELFTAQAEQKGVALYLAISDTVPDAVLGDDVRLRQVLINMISNAIKFTDTGNVQVQVSSGTGTDTSRDCTFIVSDTGIGIPADKRHLLFRPFSQVDESHTRHYGGTGIGLSISEKIVQMMGGRIGFDSTESLGSTFFFTLPLQVAASVDVPRAERETPEQLIAATPVTPAGEKPRILVAEDDVLAADLMKSTLDLVGLDMDLAQTGLEAVEKWEHGDYDLIIMDVQMPKMDGLTATRLIRTKEKDKGGHTPILAMTAHANKEEEQHCLATGMDGFLPKPVDLKLGLKVIREMISHKNP